MSMAQGVKTAVSCIAMVMAITVVYPAEAQLT